MNLRSILKGAFAACALIAAWGVPATADPAGLWLDKDGWTIRVQACGADLCAVIASVKPPLDPATGKPWTDKNNADASKRARPLIGVEVLSGMRPNGTAKWSGQLYDADRGHTLSGNLLELDQDTIRIEGCLLLLCGGEDLHRVK
ncbi:MAG: DUF2147 domain-containing protein [Alphaproteobacteria bacterium]